MLCSIVVAAALAVPQTYTVDANDPSADFQSLNTAIETVPPGAVLLLRSDMHEQDGPPFFEWASYSIEHDLTIRGDADPPPLIRGSFAVQGEAVHFHLIDVDVLGGGPESTGTMWFTAGHIILDGVNVSHEYAVDFMVRIGGTTRALIRRSEVVPGQHGAGVLHAPGGPTTVFTSSVAHVYDASPGSFFHSNSLMLGNWGISLPYDLRARDLRLGEPGGALGKGEPGTPFLVFVGLDLQYAPPSSEPWLLAPGAWSFLVVASAPLGWDLTATIPDAPELLGRALYFQALNLAEGRPTCLDGAVIGEG